MLGLKLLAMMGLGVYGIFAAVMVRQEQLMAKSLEAASEPVLRALVWVHLVFSLGVFLLALVIL